MSLLIEEVSSYLKTQLSLTEGTNLFVGRMPSTPTNAYCVIDNAGSLSRNTTTEHRSIQVLIRNSSYSAGAANAESVHSKMHKKSGILTTKVSFSVADSPPLYLGIEEDGHHTWSCNFTITIKGS